MSVSLRVAPAPFVSGQLFEQRLRLLQVLCVKPFAEPVIDLRQQLPGFVLFALLLPQPAQARRRS